VQHYSKANYYRIDGDRDPCLIAAELLRIVRPAKNRAAA